LSGVALSNSAVANVNVTATTLQGTPDADRFHVLLSGSTVQVFVNADPGPSPTFSLPLSSITSFIVNGGLGDDLFKLDFSGGIIAPANGFSILGAAGETGNSIAVIGRAALAAVFRPSTTFGSGSMILGSASMTFSGSANIELSTFASASLITPAAADQLSVSALGAATLVSGSSAGSMLSVLTVREIADLVIDASANDVPGGSPDQLAISSLGTLSRLQFNSGFGADRLVFAAGTHTLDSGISFSAATLSLQVNGSAAVNLALTRSFSSVAIASGGRLSANPGANLTLSADSLAIAGTGVLDLNDNNLVIRSGGQAALDEVFNWISSGRNGGPGGPWTGSGIISGSAKANPYKGLASALNDRGDGRLLLASLGGQTLNAQSVVVRYTWNGDANLDRRLDADDYFQIDSNYSAKAPGYRNGDFNYDRRIDIDDYIELDSAVLAQLAQSGGGGGAAVRAAEPSKKTSIEKDVKTTRRNLRQSVRKAARRPSN
jgi:hypothetical protein